MSFRAWWLLVSCVLLAPGLMAADRPVVVSSIKPLQMLVNSVAGDAVDSRLLVPPAASPHHFQLRPSDRQTLQQAAAVFWVGPALERFLQKSLAGNPRAHALWSAMVAADTGGHPHAHSHTVDPHIWLDYQQVRRMTAEIRDRLSAALPGQREHFRRRSEQFLEAFARLDVEIAQQLLPLRERPYLLMHDAYGYFEHRYGIRRQAAVSSTPEQLPGLRHSTDLRRQLQSGSVVCVFREPQFRPGMLDALLSGVDVKLLTLDPLGAELGAESGFLEFYRELAEDFASC